MLLASQNKYAEVAQILCRARADIDKRFVGNTLLFWASCLGYAQIAHVLCGARTDVDEPRTNGATLLHMASFNGHADVAQLLCGVIADIDKPSNNDRAPLHLAFQRGHAEVAQLLCRRSTIDERGSDVATSLLMSSQCGCAELAEKQGARGRMDSRLLH